MSSRIQLVLLSASLAAAPWGCSFYYSSKSISDSVQSSSESISHSSQSSSDSLRGKDDSYKSDVRDYTSTYVASGADLESFQKGIGRVAERHGITNWEEDRATYVGIGEGLRKARIAGAQYDAFKRSLAGGDPEKMNQIEQGYDSAHS